MNNKQNLRKCRRCGKQKPVNEFVDISGTLNPRGGYCQACHLIREKEWKNQARDETKSKIRKFKIVYGKWWRHYCLPEDFADEIYSERNFCPYCGDALPPVYIGNHEAQGPFRGRAHLDHMDPLYYGGEDSIRNVIYVCDECNYQKGRHLFLDWLSLINPEQRKISRKIYTIKHGSQPEQFTPGPQIKRCAGISHVICLDEEELIDIYPSPIVSGPPSINPSMI